MKLHLLNRTSISNRSFLVSRNVYPNFLRIWHYHPEIELVAILKSTGTRFIGDNIEKFQEGEVVLIGENLPHMWLNDEAYFQNDANLKAEAVSVHFKKEFLGPDFFKLPEMQSVASLLEKAELGIRFQNFENNLIQKIIDLTNYKSAVKIYKIIEILHDLATQEQYQILSSHSFINSFQQTENRRLNKIYEFVFENFNGPISSGDVADIAGMNKSAFSRFFKKTHRKSFTTYLNEIRVGYACKLLIENKESITAIAYLSGFNNISNFNRQFRNIHGTSPSSYLKFHKLEG
ncbi:transcriptional regulator [Maribacter sp. 4U21]|uniref:AraC family transcriptional regulator n=1 Tax=Maribacter sp. 4U21 TaxID=1889779 RepID=UPI000C15C5B7|nr:AraC family transcriptional regulator [Maribacter sp. 4U21]PIB30405.1 transcriptional regulator [Maribacter sp. 4U21]